MHTRPLPVEALPRVLLVESSLRQNGGLRVSLEHARRFAAAGAPTTVAVLQDVDDQPLLRPDPSLRVEMLSPAGTRFRSTAPRVLARLVRLARSADVVVAGSEIGNCLLLGSTAARLAGRPFAVLVQADLEEALREWVPAPLRTLTRHVHARVHAAVCVADSVAAGVVANGLPEDRTHVVLNGIDVAATRERAGLPRDPADDAGSRSRRLRRPGGPPTVVATGRLSEAKDFPLLVQAHARVLAAGVDHRLVIMGEGQERPTIEAAIERFGVGGSVTLAGFVEEPGRVLADADLFVLSSRSEGLPLSLLEALVLGVPVVSTRCGAGPDLILEGGRYGRLVPVGDVQALAAAIEDHLRRPAVLEEKASGGPLRAAAFDAGGAAGAVLDVLHDLTRQRARVSAAGPG